MSKFQVGDRVVKVSGGRGDQVEVGDIGIVLGYDGSMPKVLFDNARRFVGKGEWFIVLEGKLELLFSFSEINILSGLERMKNLVK